jgi:RNA polymerase sigma-70 factor (ECF subfamily)
VTGFGEVWRANRPYLVNLAYRMLGDIGAAEDVVQEAFVRWSAATDVDDDRGWLTVVTSRLCLDQLKSARSRRELPGDLPESPAPFTDPADRITLDDEVRMALLVVLQRLPPAERVAFVLHDVFGMPFESVAQSLGRPVATCRQLARRARQHVAAARPAHAVDDAEHQLVTERFIAACATGDFDALLRVLHPDVWGTGAFAGADYLRRGHADVAAGLVHFLGRATLVSAPPQLIAYLDRREFAVLRLTVTGEQVTKIVAGPGRDFHQPGAALT